MLRGLFRLREKSIALDFMGFIEISHFLAEREIVRRLKLLLMMIIPLLTPQAPYYRIKMFKFHQF